MYPRKDRNPASRPELGHLHQVIGGHLGGQPQDGGVSVTHGVTLIVLGDPPGVRVSLALRQAQPLQLLAECVLFVDVCVHYNFLPQ